MAFVAWEVHLHVACGQLYGFCTAIHRVNKLRPSAHGVEREASGVAEHVEHFLALGETLEQGTVLALIDEESCLLTL